MSIFHRRPEETAVTVTGHHKSADGVVYYEIVVRCSDNINWSVRHRYSEFYELHEKLVQDYGVPREWLPPKRVSPLNGGSPSSVSH